MQKMTFEEAVWQDPGRMSGALCFRNTRIPVSILFDYLESGRLDEFYKGYPDVTREQVHAILQASRELVARQAAAGSSM